MRICHIEATLIAVLTGRHDRDNICSQSGNARISLSAVRIAASAPQFATSAACRAVDRHLVACDPALRPRGECPQALGGTDHDGGLLNIGGAAIEKAGHTEMRARAMLVFSADVALAYIAREHKNLFWVAEESCLTPSHRRYPTAHTGRYGWAMAAAPCISARVSAFAERRRCSSCICSSARPVAAAMTPSAG